MSADDISVEFRPAGSTDLAYLYTWWLRDARAADGSPLPDDLWFPAARELINRILSDPKVLALVAHPSDNRDEILGFVVAEPHEVLHWVHVRRGPLRGRGLARLLLEAAGATDAEAGWVTPLGRTHLRNRPRPRNQRRRYGLSSTSTAKSPSCSPAADAR